MFRTGKKKKKRNTHTHTHTHTGFPGGTRVKNPCANGGDTGNVGSIPGLGRFPGGGSGNPHQYSCLENPMDTGDWRAIIHGVTKSRTQPKRLSMYTHTHTHILQTLKIKDLHSQRSCKLLKLIKRWRWQPHSLSTWWFPEVRNLDF